MAGLDSVNEVVNELFHAEEDTKAKFQEVLSPEILLFAEHFQRIYTRFQHFAKYCSHSLHTAIVGATMHSAVDDILVSVKLLLNGHMSASGNAARQAGEALCMCVMSAHGGDLLIHGKLEKYWELLSQDDIRVAANRVAKQLEANRDRLGIEPEMVEMLANTISMQHESSHAGIAGMANKMALDGSAKLYYGGQFDPGKLSMYRYELQDRAIVCRSIELVMDHLLPKLKALGAPQV